MKLSLDNDDGIILGDYLNVITKTTFEETTEILWGGLKLISKNPCKRDLIITKSEIFNQGTFEPGEYIRKRTQLINPNVVPTIPARNIHYLVKMTLRIKSPLNSQKEIEIFKENPIKIFPKENIYQNRIPTPIKLIMSGIDLEISKDIFKPGDAIKIDYKTSNLALFQIRLKQKANLICICEPFGEQCGSTEELPPVIAGGAKTSKTDHGFLLIKIPNHAEPSHEYLWEPQEKEQWGVKFGDYSKWFLEIIGNRKREVGGDIISFEIPIIIKPQKQQNIIETGLFREREEGLELFEAPPAIKKGMNIISIDTDKDTSSSTFIYKLRIKNNLKDILNGVTIESSGIQRGLFETYKHMTGFCTWLPGEEKIIEYKTRQEIDTLISTIETNSQKQIRIQTIL